MGAAFLGCAASGSQDLTHSDVNSGGTAGSGHAGSGIAGHESDASVGGQGGYSGTGGLGGNSGTAGTGAAAGHGGSSGSGGTGATGDVCLLHDCASDDECTGCPNGRTVCDTTNKRCVRCLPGGTNTCDPGQACSQYGTCVPEGMTCPTDAQGEPTVVCTTDSDCFACDTMHQVCDTATQKCVTCSDTNLYACNPGDRCKQGSCMGRCPSPCTSDADCTECGTMVNPGHACNKELQHCTECSATVPCPNGLTCGPQGMCMEVCGAPDRPKGVCLSDDDCKGCAGDLIACHVPINGGEGRCGLPASGCSDIGGEGLIVLPEPFDRVTNLCSDDDDCAGQGIDLNVGKMLRDLTGIDQINDAVMHYGMNSCASVTVGAFGESISCGICVPCKTDADCAPIPVDPLVEQAFGPVGSTVAKLLLKEVFGDNPHQIQMYCEPVIGEYGVCAPCVDFLHECAVTASEVTGCTTDWDCPAGSHCKDGKCEEYQGGCNAGSTCGGGKICAWNGDRYCCRQPGQGTKSCFSDAECVPQICSYNGTSFVCTDPDPTCE